MENKNTEEKKTNYKEKYCNICQKSYKDYYQHKRVSHSDKEKTKELCFDCGKIFQKNYIKKHKCSLVIKIAKENWGVYCERCHSFHMANCKKENEESYY